MIDGGPLNGGASAELVVNNESAIDADIQDALDSIIDIALSGESGTELHFEIVNTYDGTVSKPLNMDDLILGLSLPGHALRVSYDPTLEAPPQPVG